jgi:hypothetical protein
MKACYPPNRSKSGVGRPLRERGGLKTALVGPETPQSGSDEPHVSPKQP